MNPLRPKGTMPRELPPSVWLVVTAMLAFAGLYLFQFRHDLGYQWLEDLHVYAGAAGLLASGVNPYYRDIFEGLRFVYPPVALYGFRWLFTALPGGAAWVLLGTLHITMVLLAPFVLARYYVRARWLTPSLVLLVFLGESRFTGMLALYSANVAPTLYLAALLAAVPGLRRNQWGWFYLAVLLAGMVKITMLVLLLLPLFLGLRQWWRALTCVACVAAAYALQARLLPALYAGYKFAVLQQVQVEHQFGYGVYGVAASMELKLNRPVGLEAYAVHGIFALLVLGALVWLKQRRADAADPNVWRGMLVMAVIVVNPRMLHYDAYLALFAAYAVLAMVWRLEGWKLVALVAALYLPCLAVPHVLHAKLMYGSYELCILVAALAAGGWCLWRAPAAAGSTI